MNDGMIEHRGGTVIFRYERLLPHPVEVVWKAITEPGEIEGWTGGRPG